MVRASPTWSGGRPAACKIFVCIFGSEDDAGTLAGGNRANAFFKGNGPQAQAAAHPEVISSSIAGSKKHHVLGAGSTNSGGNG